MSRTGIREAVCRELEDVIAMAVESQRHPACFCRQLGKLLQDAILVGVFQGLDAAGAQTIPRDTVPPPAKQLPGPQQGAAWLSEVRQLKRLFGCARAPSALDSRDVRSGISRGQRCSAVQGEGLFHLAGGRV